ncbi:MAG: FAD-dependent oxidoreductase [Hyphomicrobiaceae bacterium]|nr:FAD-dependent oxidoreductase [Hyphomicrobiaceae bacterium]
MTHKTAVVGAGLAGLACARVLRRAGCYVEVFEQNRVIAGRMGTTRLGIVPFDHGAQYLTARSDRFKQYLDELVATGYAATWSPAVAGHANGGGQTASWFVGTPGMSAVLRPLAESVRIHTDRKVHTIQRVDKGWRIWFEDESYAGPFSAVAIAVPAPEATMLLGPLEDMAAQLANVRMVPCWSLMLRLDEPVLPRFDVYSDMSQTIRWVTRNDSKPNRSSRGEHLVIHAAQDWSREAADAEPEIVAEEMWSEVCHVLSLPPVRPTQMHAHLWSHALVERSLGETYLYSRDDRVGVAGDWCLGRLGEHAFESGTLLGKAIVESL